jgi:hypothetical protein
MVDEIKQIQKLFVSLHAKQHDDDYDKEIIDGIGYDGKHIVCLPGAKCSSENAT